MRLLTPLAPDPGAPLARANPAAKLGAALALMTVLFVSVDLLTPALVVAALVAAVPFSGLAPRVLIGRAWLIWFAAVTVTFVNILFAAQQEGVALLRIGPVWFGAETVATGLALGIRIAGFGLCGLLAAATTEPAELADSLVQQLRVPARFAVGALAAFRLLPVLAIEWQTIGLARRARGIDAGRSPLAAARLFGGRLLALLVASVRRGTRLALAMEARGFGAERCRTVARPMRLRASDWAWVLGAVVTAAATLGISVTVGSWRFLFG